MGCYEINISNRINIIFATCQMLNKILVNNQKVRLPTSLIYLNTFLIQIAERVKICLEIRRQATEGIFYNNNAISNTA